MSEALGVVFADADHASSPDITPAKDSRSHSLCSSIAELAELVDEHCLEV